MNSWVRFKIEKTNEYKQRIFGWALISRDKDGNEVYDSQGDNIDPDELEEAAYDFVHNSGKLGINHKGKKDKGYLIESIVTTIDKQTAMGIPENTIPIGLWLGFQVTDDETWLSILAGDLNDFSIEGTAIRVEVDDE